MGPGDDPFFNCFGEGRVSLDVLGLRELENVSDRIDIGSRVWKATGMVMLLLWILVTLHIFAFRPVVNLLKRFAKLAKPENVEGNPPFSKAIEEGIISGAYSYNIMENIEYSEPMGYFPKAARPFVDKAMESIGGVRYVQQYTESGRPTMENTAQAAPAPGSPAPSSSKGGPAPTKSKTWKKVKAAVTAGG